MKIFHICSDISCRKLFNLKSRDGWIKAVYEIKRTAYGLHIIMGGIYEKDEIRKYTKEKGELAATIKAPFSILVDLRTAMPPDGEDAELLKQSHREMMHLDLQRMAVVVHSPVLKGNARQVLFDSGVSKYTRVIDASRLSNWEELALGWVVTAIEPDISPESCESAGQPVNGRLSTVKR